MIFEISWVLIRYPRRRPWYPHNHSPHQIQPTISKPSQSPLDLNFQNHPHTIKPGTHTLFLFLPPGFVFNSTCSKIYFIIPSKSVSVPLCTALQSKSKKSIRLS